MHRSLLHKVLHQIASAVISDATPVRASASKLRREECNTTYLQNSLLALVRAYSTRIERQSLSEAHPHLVSVPVRSKLVVNTSVDVAIKTGKMEQIRVKGSLQLSGESPEQEKPYCLQAEDLIEVVEVHASATNDANLKSLEIHIPERYCSVEITSRGRRVAVQGIHEAALSVYSGGGDITLGSIKASDVILDAGEPPILPSKDGHGPSDSDFSARPGRPANITAKTITASSAEICSLGGSIAIGRLLGKEVLLNSQPDESETALEGGPVTVTAAYTEAMEIFSGGAPIHIGTLASSPYQAELWSSGGNITIGSLDGYAYIESHGGDVSLHVHDNMRRVEVYSDNGDISCRMSEKVAEKVKWSFEGGVGAEAAAEMMKGPEDDFEENGESEDFGTLHLNAHIGDIKVQKLSWIEAVQANARKELQAGK